MIAAKDFKTQNQKFKAGDTVPDDIAKDWVRFMVSEPVEDAPVNFEPVYPKRK